MQLFSSAFNTTQLIPSRFTCDGENVNPPLTISGVPPEAKSLVLLVNDPDSPSGSFLHWLVWDIAPHTKQINTQDIPIGAIEGKNDFGKFGYGGPCPHEGEHRYHLRLYALSEILGLSNQATRQEVVNALTNKMVGEAFLVGLYKRK